MSLRILIVDDHRMAREAIHTALEFCRSGQYEVVGEAADGGTAIALAHQLHPDVITMDIGLPDMTGLEVTRRLKAEMPQVRVVMVTMHKDRLYQEEAFKSGAVSYITKEHLIDELPRCLDYLASQRYSQSAKCEKMGL